ncbi:hypothetical protein GGQ84_002639 [Desulfitispora alkaliphila]|uniref:hypothetical protein n=1 Tax=Desulfitispora alkaliphila TaxID=622674 RepID=UPI003D232844
MEDPIGLYYPSTSNEYASYAWKILDLEDVWWSEGDDPDSERMKIRAGVDYIAQAIKSIYK